MKKRIRKTCSYHNNRCRSAKFYSWEIDGKTKSICQRAYVELRKIGQSGTAGNEPPSKKREEKKISRKKVPAPKKVKRKKQYIDSTYYPRKKNVNDSLTREIFELSELQDSTCFKTPRMTRSSRRKMQKNVEDIPTDPVLQITPPTQPRSIKINANQLKKRPIKRLNRLLQESANFEKYNVFDVNIRENELFTKLEIDIENKENGVETYRDFVEVDELEDVEKIVKNVPLPRYYTREQTGTSNLKYHQNFLWNLQEYRIHTNIIANHTKSCGGNWEVERLNFRGYGPGANVTMKCQKCGTTIKSLSVKKDFPSRMAGSSMMSSHSHEQVNDLMIGMNTELYGKTKFQSEINKHADATELALDEAIAEKRMEYSQNAILRAFEAETEGDVEKVNWSDERKIKYYAEKYPRIIKLEKVGADGSYSHRRQSHDHWNHLIDLNCPFIDDVDTENTPKKRPGVLFRIFVRKSMLDDDRITKDFSKVSMRGQSVDMEDIGLMRMMKLIDSSTISICGYVWNFQIVSMVVDGDTTAEGIIHSVFEKCTVLRCVGHKKKNLVKLKALTGIRKGALVMRTFSKCIFMAKGDVVLLRQLFEAYPLHWKGDHSKCIGLGKSCGKEKNKLDENQFEIVKKVFDSWMNDAIAYAPNLTNNSNESIHNICVRFTSGKRLYRKRNQNSYAAQGTIVRNKGEVGLLMPFERRQISGNALMKRKLEEKEWIKEKERKHKQKSSTRRRRREVKTLHSKIHSKKNGTPTKFAELGPLAGSGYKGYLTDKQFDQSEDGDEGKDDRMKKIPKKKSTKKIPKKKSTKKKRGDGFIVDEMQERSTKRKEDDDEYSSENDSIEIENEPIQLNILETSKTWQRQLQQLTKRRRRKINYNEQEDTNSTNKEQNDFKIVGVKKKKDESLEIPLKRRKKGNRICYCGSDHRKERKLVKCQYCLCLFFWTGDNKNTTKNCGYVCISSKVKLPEEKNEY